MAAPAPSSSVITFARVKDMNQKELNDWLEGVAGLLKKGDSDAFRASCHQEMNKKGLNKLKDLMAFQQSQLEEREVAAQDAKAAYKKAKAQLVDAKNRLADVDHCHSLAGINYERAIDDGKELCLKWLGSKKGLLESFKEIVNRLRTPHAQDVYDEYWQTEFARSNITLTTDMHTKYEADIQSALLSLADADDDQEDVDDVSEAAVLVETAKENRKRKHDSS